ncbi:MAG TPA: hypothetical protein VMH27_00730 [Puia sp.]|nr:hypothetical protein [Puia sp.]
MKSAIFAIPLATLTLTVAAQTGRTIPGSLSSLKALTIRLTEFREPVPPVPAGPFGHFLVIDRRPDTTRIGIHGNLPLHTHDFDRQLIFAKPADQEIAAFFNSHVARPGAADTAVIVLRQLWLSDTDPYNPSPEQYQAADSYTVRKNRTHIRFNAEIYAVRNHHYLPLLRIDTLQTTKRMTYSKLRSTYIGWEGELAAILREGADQAGAVFSSREKTGHWMSWDDIRRFNQTRFDIPVFDSGSLVRGVYTIFEEFRSNAPSIRDFEIQPVKGSFALYIKNADGSSSYTHQVWGFCDGRQIYLMRDGLLHPLRKDGNSYYFFGIDVAPSNSASPPLFALDDYPEQHCLYIVDMDTGRFF